TVASGFMNHGTIEWANNQGAFEGRLTVTAGTLVNAPDGTILNPITSGGSRVLEARLDNQGLMTILWPLTLLQGPASNSPSGIVRGTSQLDVSQVTYTDDGTTSPGLSPGILTVSTDDTRGFTS